MKDESNVLAGRLGLNVLFAITISYVTARFIYPLSNKIPAIFYESNNDSNTGLDTEQPQLGLPINTNEMHGNGIYAHLGLPQSYTPLFARWNYPPNERLPELLYGERERHDGVIEGESYGLYIHRARYEKLY